ncbi:MAG TPA: VOC family protein [Terriglobales bacterium]|jgi:catechol 2,3-dioxygenase-like lactoylglutathione lyase family enzyme
MSPEFPSAVPEVPVDDVDRAVAYYVKHFGFKLDWRAQTVTSQGFPRATAGSSSPVPAFARDTGMRRR